MLAHLEITSVICRLCREEIQTNPITMPTKPQCTGVGIIQQHFGIKAEHPELIVCQMCWRTTEQFHQLYTTVQHYEAVLAQQTLLALKQESKDAEESPAGITINDCKVEVLLDDNQYTIEELYLDADPMPFENTHSARSTSSTDREKEASTSSTKKRSKSKKNTFAADDAPDKRRQTQFTDTEIDEQNDRVREFFQMKCDLCETQFALLLDAITHYRHEHGQPGYLRCCGKKFFKRGMVLDHIQYHANPNAFHCARCARSYISRAALKKHMEIMHYNEQIPKPLKCVVCALEFVKQFQLTQHQRQMHGVNLDKSFGCDICGKFFFTKLQMSTHIHRAHIAAHICEICAHSFKKKALLERHYQRVHTDEPNRPKVQCVTCGALLADERCLKLHNQRHEEQVPVACTICEKVLPNKRSLSYHMGYVHSTRLFPCTICKKSFKRAMELKEHIAAHTGNDLYTCTYCTRSFKSKSNMFTHRKKNHPVEWSRDRNQQRIPASSDVNT